MRKLIIACLSAMIIITLLSGCQQDTLSNHSSSVIESPSPENSSSTSASSSEKNVDIDKLTQDFFNWAKEYEGFNEDEPAPTATYLGEKTVDGETWYMFSYNVSFMPSEKGHYLIKPDLSRIYTKKTEDDYDGKRGVDIWYPVIDPLIDPIKAKFDNYAHNFLQLAIDDYGISGSLSLRIAIADGKVCWIGQLYTDKDRNYIPYASYAMTIDEKELYRMDDEGKFYLVKELS